MEDEAALLDSQIEENEQMIDGLKQIASEGRAAIAASLHELRQLKPKIRSKDPKWHSKIS